MGDDAVWSVTLRSRPPPKNVAPRFVKAPMHLAVPSPDGGQGQAADAAEPPPYLAAAMLRNRVVENPGVKPVFSRTFAVACQMKQAWKDRFDPGGFLSGWLARGGAEGKAVSSWRRGRCGLRPTAVQRACGSVGGYLPPLPCAAALARGSGGTRPLGRRRQALTLIAIGCCGTVYAHSK